MNRAAGILFVTPDDRVLLMHRVAHKETDEGDAPDTPNTWAFPGGGLEGEETPEQAARREVQEETGLVYDGPLTYWTRRIQGDVDFTTFVARVDEFVPQLNDEHDAWQWVNRSFALGASGLHPGVPVALRRFTLDELGIAREIMAGELTSPQRYGENLMLIALRITGTGGAFRPAHDEYVWRDPSLYMNQEFLDRCNGLPVLLEHPKDTLLDSEQFREKIVGTIFVPYLKHAEQEVWGIAKILDRTAAQLLEHEEMSTSPAVLCFGDKLPVKDGKQILIEQTPHLLDHLAVLLGHAGVWDRGGPLSGVESIDVRADEAAGLDPLDLILRQLKLNEICHRLR